MNFLNNFRNSFLRCVLDTYNGLRVCCTRFVRCVTTCYYNSLDITQRSIDSITNRINIINGYIKRCFKCVVKACVNYIVSCFRGCIICTKRYCACVINCIKRCMIALCRPLQKAVTYVTLKIIYIADWNLVGKRLPLLYFFLLCIPLRFTGYIIGVVSFICSILCFSLVMVISKYNDRYFEVYANKMDVLVVLVIYLSSTSTFMVTCVFLLVGTFLRSRALVEIYLWNAMFHVVVTILSTIGVSIYCIYNNQCFNGSGLGQSVIGLVICCLYTLFWVYLLSSLNSMMENPPAPLPLSA